MTSNPLDGTEFQEMEQQDAWEPIAMLVPRFIFANGLFYMGIAAGMWIGG